MLLSYNWLKEFIQINLSPEKLAEKLTLAGFEVEKIHQVDKGIKNVVVGKILKIEKHPRADKLQMVKVDIGKKILNIVCGAPNIEKGQKIPVALPKATLATVLNGLVVQKAKIRGIESIGMMCAEDELGIGRDHTGIYVFSPEVKIGQDIRKVLDLDDVIFEIDITPNRGDCFSVLGLVREVAAILNSKFKNQKSKLLNNNQKNYLSKIKELVRVEVRDKKLCPKYTARVIKDIKVKESPQWLKNRLLACDIRPVNNVVDATNYVMLELGQPLHAFDFNKISGMKIPNPKSEILNKSKIHPANGGAKSKKIIIRKAKKGEKILNLDDKERELDEEILVIADSKKPIAIAGVMGGKESEISEATKDIILESAQFDAVSVRKTSRKLGLRSESSTRFERGIDWNITEVALDRVAYLIKKLAKGEIISERIYLADKPMYLRKVIKLPVNFTSKLLGLEIKKDKIREILTSLGLIVSEFSYFPKFSVSNLKLQLIKEAKNLLGKKYKYGAKPEEAPKYFDCSSFVQYIYKKVGIIIPRCSEEQVEVGEDVKVNKIQAGDLIFTEGNTHIHYTINHPKGIGHVGIYIGNNKVIHANRDKEYQETGVIEQTLKDFLKGKKFACARRIIRQEISDPVLIITIPSWRADINLPVDLVEEIGRIYDYNKMKPSFLVGELKPPLVNKEIDLENKIKDILIGCGFDEVYNYSFHSETQINTNKDEYWEVVNPLNPDQKYLRRSLVPRIIENIEKNLKNFDEVKIFEIGRTFLSTDKKLPEERKKITLAIGSERKIQENFFLLKGVLSILFDRLNISPFLPKVIDCQKLEKGSRVVIELDLADFKKGLSKIKKYQPLSIYPKVTRDLAVLVDQQFPYNEIEKTIKSTNQLIQKVELFDVFESEKLGKNKKSFAFHLDFQAEERTLKNEEVNLVFNKILENLKNKFKAEIRE